MKGSLAQKRSSSGSSPCQRQTWRRRWPPRCRHTPEGTPTYLPPSEHFQLVAHRLPSGVGISSDRADLIGAYLTHEYAIEAAALFNPSIAAHPDQERASRRARFVMTARAVGEGHVSSLEFRSGVLSADDVVQLDEARTRLTTGRVTQSTTSTEFLREALDEDGDAVTAQSVLGRLPEHFTPRELEDVLASSELDSPRRRGPGDCSSASAAGPPAATN